MSVNSVDISPQGISWDATNTPWAGEAAPKLYLQSGQFAATLKTSLDVNGVDQFAVGIDTDDVNARLGVGGGVTMPIFYRYYEAMRTT